MRTPWLGLLLIYREIMCEWLRGAQGSLSTADLCSREVRKETTGEELTKPINIPNIYPEINAKVYSTL